MQEARVAGENRIFRADFATRRSIQDLGGVIVACSVPGAGGVSPTGATGRITFLGTESLAVNATKMTVAFRIKTPAVFAAVQTRNVVSKSPSALNDNQWFVQWQASGPDVILAWFLASAAGDFANYVSTTAGMLNSTEYMFHLVYNGGLAAASRALMYKNGAVTAKVDNGTIPAAMRASASPVTVLNRSGGTTQAPDTDTILRTVSIYPGVAFSAADCAADYINALASGVTP